MQDHFLKVFHFEYWANKKVMDQLIANNNVAEKALQLFSHVLFAQKIWLNRIGVAQENIREDYKPKAFNTILDHNYVEMIAFIKRQKEFNTNISYTDLSGKNHRSTLQDILNHISIHGAYHRGQIVQLIKLTSNESIVTDYIAYARLEL